MPVAHDRSTIRTSLDMHTGPSVKLVGDLIDERGRTAHAPIVLREANAWAWRHPRSPNASGGACARRRASYPDLREITTTVLTAAWEELQFTPATAKTR